MNAETLRALKGSIRKWKKIVEGEGKDQWSKNCPLCQRFPGCGGCPVYKKTEESGCNLSPWKDWINHIQKNHHREANHSEDNYRVFCPTCKELARKELDFLRSLLPETKKGRKA